MGRKKREPQTVQGAEKTGLPGEMPVRESPGTEQATTQATAPQAEQVDKQPMGNATEPMTATGSDAAINWAKCTAVSDRWCPIHGECRCQNPSERMDDPNCPLHSPASSHGPKEEQPQAGEHVSLQIIQEVSKQIALTVLSLVRQQLQAEQGKAEPLADWRTFGPQAGGPAESPGEPAQGKDKDGGKPAESPREPSPQPQPQPIANGKANPESQDGLRVAASVLSAAAFQGMEALSWAWAWIPKECRKHLVSLKDKMKVQAQKADEAASSAANTFPDNSTPQ